MNEAGSEPGRQLPTTAAKENDCNATQVTSFRVEDGGLLEIIFVAIKINLLRKLSVSD